MNLNFVDQELFDYVKHSNNTLAEKCIEMGGNPNYINKEGYTPLFIAVINNNYYMVKLLLEKGANPNFKYKNIPPIWIACFRGFYNIVYILLEYKANPKFIDKNNLSLLMISAYSKNLKLIKLLVKYKTNIYHKNNDGDTILNISIKYKYMKITKYLLYFCDINHVNHINFYNNGPLEIASKTNSMVFIRFILSYQPHIKDKKYSLNKNIQKLILQYKD